MKIKLNAGERKEEDRLCPCNDIVFHSCDYFRVEEKLRKIKPIREELDLPIPERTNKIFAYPSIEDAIEKGYIHKSGLLIICVDNTKVFVSDDLDAFHQDEYEWKRKLVTLKEWRDMPKEEKETNYSSPEVIMDSKYVCESNITGVLMVSGRIVVPCKIKEWD